MSLTSLLNCPDVRTKFRNTFPKPRFSVHKSIVVPALTNHPQWIGTAFDYLFRFQLERLNGEVVIARPWIAEISFHILNEARQGSRKRSLIRLHSIALDIIRSAKAAHARFLKTGKFSADTVRRAVRLAQLDTIYRVHQLDIYSGDTGYMEAKCDELSSPVERGVLDEISDLLAGTDWSMFKAKGICVLNPGFGKASQLVGGADADVLIDDALIELKTVKSLEFTRPIFNQLIGYYLLYKIGGVTNGERKIEKVRIRQLGTYFSRYAYLHLIPVEEVVPESMLPAILNWFRKRAVKENTWW